RGGRVRAGVRASRRHRRGGGPGPAEPCHPRGRGRGGGGADQAVGRGRAPPGRAPDPDPEPADAPFAGRPPRRPVRRPPPGCGACLLGARRVAGLYGRYGREAVEGCFDEIVASTTRTYRREILAKIPSGTWTWEDYAEHDGVDEPRLHAQRITLTKLGGDGPGGPQLILDFTGTGPQARGPINHCADFADGNFLAKWLAPLP